MMLEPFRDEDGVIVEFDGHGNETGYWVQRAVESEPDAIVIELAATTSSTRSTKAYRTFGVRAPEAAISWAEVPDIYEILSAIEAAHIPCVFWVVPDFSDESIGSSTETHTLTDMRSQANAEDNTLPGRVDRLADVVTDVRNLHAFDDMNFQLLEPERAGWLQGRPRRLRRTRCTRDQRVRPSRCRTASTHRRSVSSCTPST